MTVGFNFETWVVYSILVSIALMGFSTIRYGWRNVITMWGGWFWFVSEACIWGVVGTTAGMVLSHRMGVIP